MRIALFSGNYNYVRDGANRALNRLVDHLLRRGACVRVYSPTSDTPAFEPAGELVSVRSLPIPLRSEFRVALGMPEATRRDLRAFAPNLIHLSAPDLLGTAALAYAADNGIPTVASLHTRFETYFEYYGLGLLRRWVWKRQANFYRDCHLVLSPNSPSDDHLVEMGVERERIAPWGRGVDRDLFDPRRRDLGWRRSLGYADEEMIVAYFGRLVREKGVGTFVDVVRRLRADGHHIRPLVIGSGPAEKELRQGLGDAVFLGHLDGPDLGRAVASADILLNPSLTEAFGNVNLEAMAAGLAVVSADVGSASALITNGVDGLLCRPAPAAYANAVTAILSHRLVRERLGRQARQSAGAYRWNEILDGVVDAYRTLLPLPANAERQVA